MIKIDSAPEDQIAVESLVSFLEKFPRNFQEVPMYFADTEELARENESGKQATRIRISGFEWQVRRLPGSDLEVEHFTLYGTRDLAKQGPGPGGRSRPAPEIQGTPMVNSDNMPPVNRSAHQQELLERLEAGVNSDNVPPVNTLSDYQRELLVWTLDVTEWRERTGNDQTKHHLQFEGMRLPRLPSGVTRSASAARSRAIRRLEERGLICRINRYTGDKWHGDDGESRQVRTVSIRLTALGRRVAEQLRRRIRDER